jgi:hypothetical protein
MFFAKPKPGLPARLPPGLPANYKGVPKGTEQLTSYISGPAGGVPFEPMGNGVGAMRMDILTRIKKGIWSCWFFKFDSYDPPEKANKFTLRGCVNFTGDYPEDLVEDRKRR